MPIIDRAELLVDTVTYLPNSNILSDVELSNIINNIIDYQISVDDEVHYSEALCRTLGAAATLNMAKLSVDTGGVKREKVGQLEEERFLVSARDTWSDYIKTLPDICPFLPKGGYKPPKSIGAKINPSEKFKII